MIWLPVKLARVSVKRKNRSNSGLSEEMLTMLVAFISRVPEMTSTMLCSIFVFIMVEFTMPM